MATKDKRYSNRRPPSPPSQKRLQVGAPFNTIPRPKPHRPGEWDRIIVDNDIPVTQNSIYTTDP